MTSIAELFSWHLKYFFRIIYLFDNIIQKLGIFFHNLIQNLNDPSFQPPYAPGLSNSHLDHEMESVDGNPKSSSSTMWIVSYM